ncbi:MAG: signal peptidase II [Alphaproteobacteria bacterium]|nr:signal peptidase II [Alphaproteobacteria bacterium]
MKNLSSKNLIKPLIGFGLILDFIILDQISKWLILEYVFKAELELKPLGLFDWLTSTTRLPFASVELTSFFNLSMVWNEGISFGLFQNGNPWPLTIIALAISGFFSIWLARSKTWIEAISLSMVIGGALGNVIDRLHFRAVVDFLDFHIKEWHYPAFNVADSLVSIGIVILVVNSLFFDPRNKKSAHT